MLESLRAIKFPVKPLSVGGQSVWVRALSAADAEEFAKATDGKDGYGVAVRLVCLCLCDADGKRECTDADMEQLAQLPATVITELFNAAAEINGMRGDPEGN